MGLAVESQIAAPQRSATPGHRCTCGGPSSGHECAACASKRNASLSSGPSLLPPQVRAVVGRCGTTIPSSLRPPLERHFRHDFSGVRLHTDAEAAASARSIGARAYTLGGHVVLGDAHAQATAAERVELIGHELMHVAQSARADTLSRSAIETEPAGSPAAEAQADRAGRALAWGSPFAETPVAATGIQRTNGEGGGSTVAGQAGQQGPPRRAPLQDMLDEWRNAGLLDRPFRPPDVDPIPAHPGGPAGASLAQMQAPTPLAAGAAPLLQPDLPSVGPRWVPRVLPGGGGAPSPGLAPAPEPVPLPNPWLIALLILLYPSPTAPPWADEVNWPITGEPYWNEAEYRWVWQLSEAQRNYLRDLVAARRLRPDPTVEDDLDDVPVPVPQPAPRRREREPDECEARDVPRRGGFPRHDAYATLVTGSTQDYFARMPRRLGGLAINYDGRQRDTTMVWEVKVCHGWFFNPAFRDLRDLVLARWDAQKHLGMAVALTCGLFHLWAIPNPRIVTLLTFRWGGIPPVLPRQEGPPWNSTRC
jgi:Domain of unknown function (DUF4157)